MRKQGRKKLVEENTNNIHKGHRDRLRTRFLKDGLEDFQEHQVLELLLFYAIPRKDTNDISHQLLKHFGTLENVLKATDEERREYQISESAALFLHLTDAICSRYYQSRYQEQRKGLFLSFESMLTYIQQFFQDTTEEQFLLLLSDTDNTCIFRKIVHRGAITRFDEFIRKVVELAVSYHASGLILVHHLADGSLPSLDELDFLDMLKESFQPVHVRLIDYIVCTASVIISVMSPDAPDDLAAF